MSPGFRPEKVQGGESTISQPRRTPSAGAFCFQQGSCASCQFRRLRQKTHFAPESS
jgi:hypothetical protein